MPGPELRRLARAASTQSGWRALRQYARTQTAPEPRGLAFFVVGYREYEAGNYSGAVEDLREAASTRFSLAEFAEYYLASSVKALNQPAQVVEILDGFPARHPASTLLHPALAMLARACIETHQADRALKLLLEDPHTRARPSLAFLLAEAYLGAEKPLEAARAYEDVYYAFPTSPEAQSAGDVLITLKAQLGPDFPAPTDEIRTARANTLFNKGRFTAAEKEYKALLGSAPQSPLAGRWKLGLGRCLIRMKRVSEAIDLWTPPILSDPEADAERLAGLVDAYVRQDDPGSIEIVIDQIRSLYPKTQACASALLAAGNFFFRQADLEKALLYYQPVNDEFPGTSAAREANWRLAWVHYLRRDAEAARRALMDHLARYPGSSHTPSALYWLGRVEEDGGDVSTARELYKLLVKRFPHAYFAVQARKRLIGMNPGSHAGRDLSPPDPAVLAAAQAVPAPSPPPLPPCSRSDTGEALRPFEVLSALSLTDLAGNYLRDLVADHPETPGLRLVLSRFEADQGRPSVAIFSAKKLVPEPVQYEFSDLPKEVWDLLYPRAYWDLVRRQALSNRLDPYLVMGLIRQESAFNPRATSSANARGLMQLLPQTATHIRRRRAAVARRLYNPAYNIRLGCAYLRSVLKDFGGIPEQALAAYNAGDIRVREWLNRYQFREAAEFAETIPFRETISYVQTVLRDAEIYRQLITGKAQFARCEMGSAAKAPAAPAHARKPASSPKKKSKSK